MLMCEPLAATLLSGGVSLAAALGRGTRRRVQRRASGWSRPAARSAGAGPARVPGRRAADAVVVWRRRAGTTGAGLGAGRDLLAGLALVVAPWTIRNAIALDRFVPISTGGGQVLFAGTYMPSDGDPERVGAEVLERHPGLFGPDAAAATRLEQILAALAGQRYPGLETDAALARMGRERLWDDVSERAARVRGFRRGQDRADLVARATRRDARAGLAAAALALVAFGLLGLASSPASAAGRRCCWRRPARDHRDRAPCSSPRRGGCW